MPAETDPLVELVRLARAALAAAGLERRALGESVYWIGGAEDAPPIVLVHGANDHAGTWAPVVPALLGSMTLAPLAGRGWSRKAGPGEGSPSRTDQDPSSALRAPSPRTRGEGNRPDHFRLLIPDLPGHGESGPRRGPIPVPQLVDSLHAVISHELGDRSFTLVGNSLGAWVTMLYVLAHPEHVRQLVLESGGGLARPLGVPLVARNRDESLAVLRAVHGPHAPIADWMIDALIERGAKSPLVQILETDWKSHFVDARLGAIRVPTKLIWGAHDTIVPRSYVDAIVGGIPGATIEVIDDAAHIPHLQKPEEFVRCLTATF